MTAAAQRRLKKVRRAKRGVRSELSVSGGEWSKHGYARSDILKCGCCVCAPLPACGSHALLCCSEPVHDTLPRVDARFVSPEVRARDC
jgi:hypothetical protein